MSQASIKRSGRNIWCSLVATTYDELRSGYNDAVGHQCSPLGANTPCFEVLVQADPDNAQDVWLGCRNGGCNIHLQPGDTVTLSINNVNKVFVRADAGVQRVNWIAGV